MQPSYCIILYRGMMYRIPKAPFETEERAHDRGWYVAKKLHETAGSFDPFIYQKEYEKILNESHIYANKKYFGMEY